MAAPRLGRSRPRAPPWLRQRHAAWYVKPAPTFADILAVVRRRLWPAHLPSHSIDRDDLILIPGALFDRPSDALAFAA